MVIAIVVSEDTIYSVAFHHVKRYGREDSVSDFKHEVDSVSNHCDAVVCVSYAYVTFEWSDEVSKISRYESGIIELYHAHVSSTTEYRFRTCHVGPRYTSIFITVADH